MRPLDAPHGLRIQTEGLVAPVHEVLDPDHGKDEQYRVEAYS